MFLPIMLGPHKSLVFQLSLSIFILLLLHQSIFEYIVLLPMKSSKSNTIVSPSNTFIMHSFYLHKLVC